MQFREGTPLYSYEVQREGGEDILYINYFGAPFVPNISDSPDVIGKFVTDKDWGRLAVRGVARRLTVEDASSDEEHAFGYGVGVGAKIKIGERDSLVGDFKYGDGIGRYLNDGASAGSVGGTQGVYMRSGATSDINNAEFRYMKIGTSYDNSPIDLENIIYDSNELGVSAASGETILKASNITFIGNVATSTIPLN